MSLFYFFFLSRIVNPILSTECTMIYTPNHRCCMPYYTPFCAVNEIRGAWRSAECTPRVGNGERGNGGTRGKHGKTCTKLFSPAEEVRATFESLSPPKYTYVHIVFFLLSFFLSLVILHKRPAQHTTPKRTPGLATKMINCPR